MLAGLLLIGFAFVTMVFSKPEDKVESLSSIGSVGVNLPAPDLSLENMNGQTEALADYRETVVLVNNWATWCPPCKAEMPTLVAYYNDHKSEGFTIIAIEAGDLVDIISPFVESYNLEFPVWLDPNGASLRAFGNSTLPSSYVIDRSGIIRYAWTGEINREMLEKCLTPLLKEN